METKESWKVETISEAFEKTGRNKIDFSIFPEDMREHMEAYYNSLVITEAINEGDKFDWDNYSQPKWTPWFVMSPSGFCFFASTYANSLAYAGGGSRLRFGSKGKASYAAKQFIEVWRNVQIK